jgi:hypothetical protein
MVERIAADFKPLAAAVDMHPTLPLRAFNIIPVIKVIGPCLVIAACRMFRPVHTCFTAITELGKVAQATPGAGNSQHGVTRKQDVPGISALLLKPLLRQ